MQDDIFAQRHERYLTIYTACTSLLAETCKKGTKVTSPTYAHPVYCSSIPSTRHMHYQTIPRTNRIWHFCQACWFKLPYQLERQESSVSASPYTHLCVKISSTNITWHLSPSNHCILIQNKLRSGTAHTEPTSGLELLFQEFTPESPRTA